MAVATNESVDRAALTEFLRTRHRAIIITTRADGSPQSSPVTCGVDGEGRIVVSTYPERAKVGNARGTRGCRSACCPTNSTGLGPGGGPGRGVDLPERSTAGGVFPRISGEHPDWDEYREAMTKRASLMRVAGPLGPGATGGFPARLA